MAKEKIIKSKDTIILAMNEIIDPIFYTTTKYIVKDILYKDGICDYLSKEKNSVKKIILSEDLDGIDNILNTIQEIKSYVNLYNINLKLYVLLKEKNLALMSKLKELGVYKILITTPRSLVNILADIFDDQNIYKELDKEIERKIKEVVLDMKEKKEKSIKHKLSKFINTSIKKDVNNKINKKEKDVLVKNTMDINQNYLKYNDNDKTKINLSEELIIEIIKEIRRLVKDINKYTIECEKCEEKNNCFIYKKRNIFTDGDKITKDKGKDNEEAA